LSTPARRSSERTVSEGWAPTESQYVAALGVHVELLLVALPGRVLADDLDELAVARALAVGDDDAVGRGLLAADAAEADANHVRVLGVVERRTPGLIATPASPARTRVLRGA
jgi:hypothetical protein